MVDRRFSQEALDFGQVVENALESAGGTSLVMRSEVEMGLGGTVIAPLLGDLGVWDLDALSDQTQLEAAATTCRVSGSLALPYPVAERLTRTEHVDADAIAVVDGQRKVNIADLSLRWMAVDTDGVLYRLMPRFAKQGVKLAPFAVDCDLTRTSRQAGELVPLGLVLSSFTLLGMLERAIALTVEHISTRHQFGSSLASFQSVQYQAVDAIVAVQALEELARYALWSLGRRKPRALVDAVALRAEAISSADTVFRVGHQLHGATGFCDESFISWLSRHSQALRRLPTNGPATDAWLASLVEQHGFDGLFPDEPDLPPTDQKSGGPAQGNGKVPPSRWKETAV